MLFQTSAGSVHALAKDQAFIRDGKLIGDAIVLSSGAGYEMVSDDAHKFTVVNDKTGVKTGDNNNILIPLAVMLSAMLALLIIAERRRRKA